MKISDFVNNISKITDYNELASNKDLNIIIHSNNKEKISNIIDMENIKILDVIHQLMLSVIDNENKIFLNYLIDNHIEQYYPFNDIVNFIIKSYEYNEKRIKFIINNEKSPFRISSLPFRHATIMASSLSLVFSLTLAPCSINNLTISSYPYSQALIKSVVCFIL